MTLYLRSLATRLQPSCSSCVTSGFLVKGPLELGSLTWVGGSNCGGAVVASMSTAAIPRENESWKARKAAYVEAASQITAKGMLSSVSTSFQVPSVSRFAELGSEQYLKFQKEYSRLNSSAVPEPRFEPPKQHNVKPPPIDFDPGAPGGREPAKPRQEKPSENRLDVVANQLEQSLSNFFYQSYNYHLFSANIELIDNIRGKRTVGLPEYVRQVFMLRFYGHLRFAFVEMELVSLSKIPQENRITIRWRIKGVSGLWVFLKFWKYKLWQYKEVMRSTSIWKEGISHYDLGDDGLIHRHIIDNMEEDREKEPSDPLKLKKLRLAAKLAGATGASPAPTACSSTKS